MGGSVGPGSYKTGRAETYVSTALRILDPISGTYNVSRIYDASNNCHHGGSVDLLKWPSSRLIADQVRERASWPTVGYLDTLELIYFID